jgi:hypothetical protein
MKHNIYDFNHMTRSKQKNPFCDPISQQQNYNIHKFQILFELTTYNWLQEHKTTFKKPYDIIINNIWHAWKTYDNKCPYHHATIMTWKHNVTKWQVVTNNKLNNPTLIEKHMRSSTFVLQSRFRVTSHDKKILHVFRFTYNTPNMNIIQSILYNQNEVIQLLNPQPKVLKINDDYNNTKNVFVSIYEPMSPSIWWAKKNMWKLKWELSPPNQRVFNF